MRDIKHLPEAVRSSVRSGIVLFNLTRVVEELIFNSLDARATKVSVAVGVGTHFIKVVDNATSKVDQLANTNAISGSFGYRGEALSSISDVSLLEVITKAHGRPNGHRKVMKGCKCLYLGIDDGRQDVGTTVIVRDLFYNQPVRRKHIQSSPKKVLHSVKKCVLRIAIVHPKVFFEVVDIESEDELFCTTPSSSPLSLLTSGFGIEISSSLHELNVSDGVLKLSGYVSSPRDTSFVKACQFVYINSLYICKGPIHKLLNELVTRFNSSDLQEANMKLQNGKRSRSQTYETYILNLSCPRSWYDITFEPSKTSVEFKDWSPIINFIEKAITHLWTEKFSHGNSSSRGTVMSEEDNTWREGDDVSSPEKDCTLKETHDPLDSGLKWQKSCLRTARGDKLHNLHNESNILDVSSGILHLAGDSLVPESINKNCLEDAKVLQQVDKKFIPIVGGGVLAIIDQHAADERIRLEELRQKVLSGEMKTVTYLDTEQKLVLPEIGYQLLHNYADQIQNWGWLCNIRSLGSRSFKKNLNLLHRQPTVVTLNAVPCIVGVNLTDVDLLEFLQQLADTDGSSTIPPSVHRVLNSKACRGAIMFGDTLLPSECSLIVEELKQTSLCFQ